MDVDVGSDARGLPRRMVMLVDNGVNGDSRVQKSARSAADAGWDVILLGKSPDENTYTWHLGRAEVRLVPMRSPLAKRRHEFRRRWLLAPFAFPPNGIAAHRAQSVKAWRADLRVRLAGLDLSAAGVQSGLAARVRKGALQAQLLSARLLGYWVSFRYRQLTSAQKARRKLDGLWDRAYTFFWQKLQGDRSWRRLEPGLWDYELAYGKVIDELAPDLIHAHDFRMLGVGARATIRARSQGRPVKLVWDAHEFVPGLKPWQNNARWLPAHCAYEREYGAYPDAVVTVSEALAEMLQQRHGLGDRPAVVLNAPTVDYAPTAHDWAVPNLRELCGIGPEVPLLVYCGLAAKKRGIDIMVEALPRLHGSHVAFVVSKPAAPYVLQLLSRAGELGVADRVHVLPYVPHEQVVSFLSSADVGVIPIHHHPNHEISLITKFFEYAQARLPMVVSDVRTMADTTRSAGLGEVFRAEDVEDYVRAVNAVLAEPKRYRSAYDRPGLLQNWTWEAQAKILHQVYQQLLADPPGQPAGHGSVRATAPDVSVIVAVYNAMPYLSQCLNSLVGQSIGLRRLEIVAVDDGSTDGSGKQLDRFASRYPGIVTVIHQDHSGGPAGPSNVGLEHTTGRYVFFIGADDHLGREALERLVSAADQNGSDVVLGRMVGVNGRFVPKDIFASTQTDIDLFNSPLPFALSNTKLFRREMIERHKLRYREDLPVYSDQPFTLEACVRAERISVLADYDYYYAVRRRDDSNVTVRSGYEERLRCTEEIMKVTARFFEPGPRRDAINHRHFAWELSKLVGPGFLDLDRAAQERICAGVERLVEEHLTDAISDRLDVSRRLRLRLAQRGYLDELLTVIRQDAGPDQPPIVVEGYRLYAGYHCFRKPRLSLPDSLFQITADPAESIARQLDVTSVVWGPGHNGTRALTVTARSQVELTEFGPAPVRMNAGQVSGQVTIDTAREGAGTLVLARFPLNQLLAQSKPLRERREIRVQVDVHGTTCDLPLRVPSGLAAPTQLGRRGHRPYRINVSSNKKNYLVTDVAPVTWRQIIDRVQRMLRKGRN